MKTLRLILGDQLNENHSWFSSVDDQILYCIFEMRQETNYVQHHIQKVIGFFAAILLGFWGILYYPIKRALKNRKERKMLFKESDNEPK